MVSIPACHAGDRGSIPRLGGLAFRDSSCEINEPYYTYQEIIIANIEAKFNLFVYQI